MKISNIILIVIFLSCKPNIEAVDYINPTKSKATSVEISNDTLALIQKVKGFLTWYKENYKQANSFGFTYQDKQGNYHVSISQGEEYLNYLKSSSYISDKYVDAWLKYFKDKAQYLEENLQNEGPPEGFEFDLVLITQEPELVLNEINKLQFAVSEYDETNAILQVVGPFGYDFEMVKENGKWMIEYIATMNYD